MAGPDSRRRTLLNGRKIGRRTAHRMAMYNVPPSDVDGLPPYNQARSMLRTIKGDIWSIRGALQKHAKKNPLNWEMVRREVKEWRAARQMCR